MATSTINIVRMYLGDEISLDALREWLALHQWELDRSDLDLADSVDVALTYLDDGYIDLRLFRANLAIAVEPLIYTDTTFEIGDDTPPYYSTVKPERSSTADARELVVMMY